MQMRSLRERLRTMPSNKRWEIARRAAQWAEDGGPDAEKGAEALKDIADFEHRVLCRAPNSCRCAFVGAA